MQAALRELIGETGDHGVNTAAVLLQARSHGLVLDRDDLCQLFALEGQSGVFAAPAFIPGFLCAYLRERAPRPCLIVDLWAAAGWMLPPLVEELRPAHAIGVVPDGRSGKIAELLAPPGQIAWRTDDAGTVAARLEPGVDVILGCPPWHWQPRNLRVETANGPILLTEDPANAALLTACTRLAPGGVGLFIVGPGFVMRPGPGTAFANLERFGLSLQLMLELPRGIFVPDSGTGRLMIGIGPAPCPAPLVGSLTPDPHRTATLLAALHQASGPDMRRRERRSMLRASRQGRGLVCGKTVQHILGQL